MGRNVRVIVVGCGAFGSAVARSLSSGGNEVIAVDMREEAFDQLGDDFVGETVTGDGSSALLLQETGAGLSARRIWWPPRAMTPPTF